MGLYPGHSSVEIQDSSRLKLVWREFKKEIFIINDTCIYIPFCFLLIISYFIYFIIYFQHVYLKSWEGDWVYKINLSLWSWQSWNELDLKRGGFRERVLDWGELGGGLKFLVATTVCWNRLHNMLNSDREAQYNFTLKFMNVSWVGRAHRCILKHHPLINEDLDGINTRESSCFNANTRWFANSLRAISSNPCVISMEMVYRFFFSLFFFWIALKFKISLTK